MAESKDRKVSILLGARQVGKTTLLKKLSKKLEVPIFNFDYSLNHQMFIPDREALEKGTSMLFVFKEPGAYRFWNRNMRFPIDIIWIRDGTVVDLWEHLPEYAAEKDFTVTPKAAANFILEVPDGFIREYAMHVGDKATYEPEKN